jgi:hypothetical protein
MTSVTSIAKSRPVLGGGGVASRLVRSATAFGGLCLEIIRTARELEAATTDHQRRQIAQRDISLYRAA